MRKQAEQEGGHHGHPWGSQEIHQALRHLQRLSSFSATFWVWAPHELPRGGRPQPPRKAFYPPWTTLGLLNPSEASLQPRGTPPNHVPGDRPCPQPPTPQQPLHPDCCRTLPLWSSRGPGTIIRKSPEWEAAPRAPPRRPSPPPHKQATWAACAPAPFQHEVPRAVSQGCASP